ncbi:hypothetical protein D5R81_09725 [Parashewanella spongiae]|uniref:Uncharacterized protein n=1 Tax=Parashewanella spongiae TaxID=342950 RepID=A0A3A6UFU6_9GAMM|nr:ankyrin repeat domain-containing protein [Parashewanella spongiae]MCL1078657.1 ankyrin repeat domain-containing protein [Parashewanella spongiae]RJY16308.1 hypothetical protein D5R81_09725 [Parashewanella spongiae]
MTPEFSNTLSSTLYYSGALTEANEVNVVANPKTLDSKAKLVSKLEDLYVAIENNLSVESRVRVNPRLEQFKSNIQRFDDFKIDQVYKEQFGSVEDHIDELCIKLNGPSTMESKEAAVIQLQCEQEASTGKVMHLNTHRALITLNAGIENITVEFEQALVETVFSCVRSYLTHNRIKPNLANISACVAFVSNEMGLGLKYVNRIAATCTTVSETQLSRVREIARTCISPSMLMQLLIVKYKIDANVVKKCFLLTSQKISAGQTLTSSLFPNVILSRESTGLYRLTEVASKKSFAPDICILNGYEYDLLDGSRPVNWALMTQVIAAEDDKESLFEFAKKLIQFKAKSCEDFVRYQMAVNTLTMQLIKLNFEKEFVGHLMTKVGTEVQNRSNDELAADLFDGIGHNGHIALARTCSTSPNVVNCRLANGTYLIQHAVSKNDLLSLVLLLNQENVDTNKVTPKGNTALHFAIQSNNYDEAKLILFYCNGVDLSIKNIDGRNALHEAALTGNVRIFKLLIKVLVAQKLKGKIFVTDEDVTLASTMLYGEVQNVYGSLEASKAIFDAAIQSENKELVRYLETLNETIDFDPKPINKVSAVATTPSIKSKIRTQKELNTESQLEGETVSLTPMAAVDVAAPNKSKITTQSELSITSQPEGETVPLPPVVAVDIATPNKSKIRIQSTSQPEVKTAPLLPMVAVDVPAPQVAIEVVKPCKTLKELIDELNTAVIDSDTSAVVRLCEIGDFDIFESSTSIKLDPFKVYGGQNYSAFQLACKEGKKDIMELMLSEPSKFKHSDLSNDNKTVFELALENRHSNCALLLLQTAPWDEHNTTPLHLAVKHNSVSIVENLKNIIWVGEESEEDEEDFVITEEQKETSRKFINLASYINAPDGSGEFPIFLAMRLNRKAIVSKLGKSGCQDLLLKNSSGKTVREVAKSGGFASGMFNLTFK